MRTERITLSDRVVSASVAALCAVITAGVLEVVTLAFPGAWGWIPLAWLGYFVGLMAVVGFVVGPVQIAEIFGFLWGTSTALSNKAQIAILSIIVIVIWVALYIGYFMR
jgi:hypothetical protein